MYYINKHYTRKDVSIEERGFWVYKILNLLCKISHIKQVNKQEGVELIVQSWQYEFEFSYIIFLKIQWTVVYKNRVTTNVDSGFSNMKCK